MSTEEIKSFLKRVRCSRFKFKTVRKSPHYSVWFDDKFLGLVADNNGKWSIIGIALTYFATGSIDGSLSNGTLFDDRLTAADIMFHEHYKLNKRP